jgi:hypothetical protein
MQPDNKVVNVPPTYRQMLEEMGRQLSERRSALFKRVFLITWPFLLLIVALFILNEIYDFNSIPSGQSTGWVILLILYIFVAVVYSTIIRFIFEIEKQIWVDSYFDQKNLTLSQSWNLAKRLFWPAIVFRFRISVQYYLIPMLVAIISVVVIVYFVTLLLGAGDASVGIISYFIAIILFLIGIFGYSYYIRTKLRYVWFIFLDKFGSDFSYNSAIEEMNNLNRISKSEIFKKSLILNIGTDSINSLARSIIGTISYGMSSFGNTGKMLGGLMRVYGEEASRQATDLGNISAHYILYRFARKEAYGTEQRVNENLYRLSEDR